MACTLRRHMNRFDADTSLPTTGSADTSVSSVNTEPHVAQAEPTPRHRVLSPQSCGGRSPTDGMTTPGTGRKQNNPYMYNVLGEHASPDFAARTSPIPRDDSPYEVTVPRPQPTATSRALTFDWDEEHSMNHSAREAGPGTAPTTPILGGYMAQCYSSAFPPGHLPKPATEFPIRPTPQKEPTTRRRGRGRVANNAAAGASSNATGRATNATSPTTSPVDRPGSAMDFPQQPASPTTVSPVGPSSPTSPTSPTMTRVYRNGRPVPVPTSTATVSR